MDLYEIVGFFQSGGVFMYPILVVLAIGIAIAIDRYIYLSYVDTRNKGIWKRVLPLLESGRYEAARDVVVHSNAALGRILSYGLNRADRRGNREEVQMAMEEGLLEVVPRLEKRTHYLATLANVATLLGLLGTIIGLTEAFSTVAGAEPAEKANQLSASISIAMNTTAFGLMVAIPLLLIHAVMQTKTSALVDMLETATVRLSNLIGGAPAADGSPS
ncbi:MAG TPA: MotA/TolQ/ExbB proton channel family protein [Alphaproteobacteria bacterium]|nr:MotA/TolQ/ExbB proton channel family protein [Alphaproteobacteria bacterium]